MGQIDPPPQGEQIRTVYVQYKYTNAYSVELRVRRKQAAVQYKFIELLHVAQSYLL